MDKDRSTPPACQQCAALQTKLNEVHRECDELRAMNRELSSAYEEHRRAQQVLIDMYRNRERDNLQRDQERERERVRLHKLQ